MHRPSLSVPRRHRVPGVRSLLAVLLALASSGALAPGGASGSTPVPRTSACTTHTVTSNSSAQTISDAIKAAHNEQTHPSWAVGPTGDPQGVVYFQPGAYSLAPITFLQAQSDVRLVFDPGVKLRPAPGTSTDLFTLGAKGNQTHNVSFVAGDGCGTVDYPSSDLRFVWANTDQRRNDPGIYRQTSDGFVAGMPNIDLGGQPGWPRTQLARMWVLDLDPAGGARRPG